jgi:hypothetical protein
MVDAFQGLEYVVDLALSIAITAQLANVQSSYDTLAKNYFILYQTQRNFYFSNFQLSGEAPFATEQFGIPFYTPDYVGLFNTGYFPPGVWYLFNPEIAIREQAFGGPSLYGYWARMAARYGTTQNDGGSVEVDFACILDDWNSYQNRYEEHKRDVFNERRWANQQGSLSYGVKEAYTVERGLATSFSIFDEAQGQLISEDDTLMNGLATFAGYRQIQKALREDLGTVPNYQSNSFLTNVIPQLDGRSG